MTRYEIVEFDTRRHPVRTHVRTLRTAQPPVGWAHPVIDRYTLTHDRAIGAALRQGGQLLAVRFREEEAAIA